VIIIVYDYSCLVLEKANCPVEITSRIVNDGVVVQMRGIERDTKVRGTHRTQQCRGGVGAKA
jgi:hypothetical protein